MAAVNVSCEHCGPIWSGPEVEAVAAVRAHNDARHPDEPIELEGGWVEERAS